MKRFVLHLIIVGLFTSAVSAGSTVYLANYMVNPGFEEELPTVHDFGQDFLGANVREYPNSTHGWYVVGDYGYYFLSNSTISAADGNQYLQIQSPVYAAGQVAQKPLCDLVDGNTYIFDLAYRDGEALLQNDPGTLTVFINNQAVTVIGAEKFTDEWQTTQIAYTHSGATVAAGNWEVYFYHYSAVFASGLFDIIAGPSTPPLLGDANHDGIVSTGDYACVQSNMGNTGVFGILGDANYDGVVSEDDYDCVEINFGNVAESTATPEPATMGLIGLGALGLIRRKK